MKIAVAGAGIAGLAAAAFLARDGHDVTIFDQFPEPRPVGSGMVVQPVGLAVLASLGLDRALVARASRITRVFGRNATGRVVLDVNYGDLRAEASGYGIQRSVLFDLLLGAARAAGARLVPGTTIQGVRGAPPVLLCEHSDTGPFDLVLDCMGTNSPLCPEPSEPLAYGALWALLDFDPQGPFAPDWLEQRYHRAARMVGVLPVGTRDPDAPHRLTFFWSLRGEDFPAWRARPLDDWKDEVRTLWPETGTLLDQITRHEDLILARYAHRTLSRPGRDRIAHLGDSFHATSPQLGQGANMALLDAAALAAALRLHTDPARATAHYAWLRGLHVRLYQSASYLFTPVYQSDSRVLPWLRDWVTGPLSSVPPVPGVLARLVAGEFASPLTGVLKRRRAVSVRQ